MNYRHHFHAGNFADVFKHALLVQLVLAMQRKEKGFLYLDTHAGRGSYDLRQAATGSSLPREPEHPAGIGRLEAAPDLSPPVADYFTLVRNFDRQSGHLGDDIRFYPGSPGLVRLLSRVQDRLVLCERHPADHAALAAEFGGSRRVSVQNLDGYTALRAMLPPPERRALVLIDPPYESEDEWRLCIDGIEQALGRMPAAVLAVWYPLTRRSGAEILREELTRMKAAPTLSLEVAFPSDGGRTGLRGCGLAVLNPPWQFAGKAEEAMNDLGRRFGQQSELLWLIPETTG